MGGLPIAGGSQQCVCMGGVPLGVGGTPSEGGWGCLGVPSVLRGVPPPFPPPFPPPTAALPLAALLGALWALRALRRWWRRRSSHSISFGNPLFLKEHGGHQVSRAGGRCGADVGRMWGGVVGHGPGVELWGSCGLELWGGAVGHGPGVQLWGRAVGRRCGAELWGACGAELWGGCGAELWGTALG